MIYDLIKNSNVIPICQGSNYRDTVKMTQPDGTPMDLTGYIVTSQLRTVTGELAATFTCTVPTPANGEIKRTISATDTAKLNPATNIQHVWGLQMVAPDGGVEPEQQGGAMVAAEVVI